MYIESQAIVGTMLRLKRKYDVPCLSIHDSVIVPASTWETAVQTLSDEYTALVGIAPRLKLERNGMEEEVVGYWR